MASCEQQAMNTANFSLNQPTPRIKPPKIRLESKEAGHMIHIFPSRGNTMNPDDPVGADMVSHPG